MVQNNALSDELYLRSLDKMHICKREMNNSRIINIKLASLLLIISILNAFLTVVYFYFS
jgi:hypothetical protein